VYRYFQKKQNPLPETTRSFREKDKATKGERKKSKLEEDHVRFVTFATWHHGNDTVVQVLVDSYI